MYNEINEQAYIVNGRKVKNNNKITALLCRLSKEDGIIKQKIEIYYRFIGE